MVEVRRGDHGIGDGYWVGGVREGTSREVTRERSVRRERVEEDGDGEESISVPGTPRESQRGVRGGSAAQSPRKRPAPREAVRGKAKRQKAIRIESEDEDDSDDDGLKFRLR